MTPPSGVDDVIERMARISSGLPPRDGVRAFNDMYLETTRQVALAITDQVFADPVFLELLDVRFAELYFDAVSVRRGDGRRVSRSWGVLFSARSAPNRHPLQFALAGMNAHIAYDLPRALVRTATELGRDLDDPAVRADYLAINQVLARTQPMVKAVLMTGWLHEIDDALGQVDDRAQSWAISQARQMAWVSAQALWEIRGTWAASRFEDGLDRLVAANGHALLL